MTMGHGYDSHEGRALCGALTALLTGTSYATSAEIASEVGAFPGYGRNAEHMLRVVRNHRRAAQGLAEGYEGLAVPPVPLDAERCPDPRLAGMAASAWDEALRLGQAHGYRNAQATVIAPTGTIGLVMDCDTTGIEPDFALVKFKKLAGGGYFKIINRSVPAALRGLGYGEARHRGDRRPRGGPRHAGRRPGRHPTRRWRSAASAPRSWPASRRRCPRPSTSASSSTSGRWGRRSAPTRSASPRSACRTRASTCCAIWASPAARSRPPTTTSAGP